MRDAKKTKEQLIQELAEMRQRIAELESLKAYRNRAEETLQRAYDELELRIAARTAELVQANQQLKQEIEERKRTETELKRIKEYLENVIDNSVDAIGIVDRHGKFILWNRRAAEIYGYQLEELAAANMPTVIRSLTHAEFELLFRHGYEVADYTLSGYNADDFQFRGYNSYAWPLQG